MTPRVHLWLRRVPAAMSALAFAGALTACVSEADTGPAGSSDEGTPRETVTVVRVDDGDSLLVVANGREEKARLLGINAPERDDCMGREALDRLRALVEPEVQIETGPEPRDRFGRLLVSVWTGDVLVNEKLVADGMALAFTTEGPYADRLLAAEERARSARSGLWSPDICGGGTIPDVRIERVNPNPPGPDDQALDEETVVIANHDATEVNLGGWVLRDESSSNRFVFPPGTGLQPGASLVVATGCADGPERLGWCAGSPVWNNGGDSALLLDPSGRVVDHLHYSG